MLFGCYRPNTNEAAINLNKQFDKHLMLNLQGS
jgi:hypothetical protein